jgi:flagellar motor component MotA
MRILLYCFAIFYFIPLGIILKTVDMKKILAIACMVMFVGSMAIPVMAENPPKEKAKTTQTTKTGTKAQDKKDGKKCTGACCADKDKATTAK